MKTILGLVFTSMLMIVAAPAYSGVAMQMWKCELDDGVPEQDVIDMAADWLKAAKTVKGGERLEAYVNFPIAVNDYALYACVLDIVAAHHRENDLG